MMTLSEIEGSYKQLLDIYNAFEPQIAQSQKILRCLEEIIYDEKTHHDNSKFTKFISHIISHMEIVRFARTPAKELLILRDEIRKKIEGIKKYGNQYVKADEYKLKLVKIAIDCEALAGDLYQLGGELDERMLYLTRLYLDNSIVHDSIHTMAQEHQELFNFCIPWIKYHRHEETEPFMKVMQNSREVRNSCPIGRL